MWYKSVDAVAGALLLVAGLFPLPLPGMPVQLGQLVANFGVVVLGTGLVLDLWRLLVQKVQPGEPKTAMCLESIVGALAVAVGLALQFAPRVPGWWASSAQLSALLGVALCVSAWLHDMVLIKHEGHWTLLREPEHGSFILFGARALKKRE